MEGRAFLESARLLLTVPSEANWRSAASRAAVGLLNEAVAALTRWGFPLPAGTDPVQFARDHLSSALVMDAVQIDLAVVQLLSYQENADHNLLVPGIFADGGEATRAVILAGGIIDLIDQIDGDPNRRAAVIAAIQAARP